MCTASLLSVELWLVDVLDVYSQSAISWAVIGQCVRCVQPVCHQFILSVMSSLTLLLVVVTSTLHRSGMTWSQVTDCLRHFYCLTLLYNALDAVVVSSLPLVHCIRRTTKHIIGLPFTSLCVVLFLCFKTFS